MILTYGSVPSIFSLKVLGAFQIISYIKIMNLYRPKAFVNRGKWATLGCELIHRAHTHSNYTLQLLIARVGTLRRHQRGKSSWPNTSPCGQPVMISATVCLCALCCKVLYEHSVIWANLIGHWAGWAPVRGWYINWDDHRMGQSDPKHWSWG